MSWWINPFSGYSDGFIFWKYCVACHSKQESLLTSLGYKAAIIFSVVFWKKFGSNWCVLIVLVPGQVPLPGKNFKDLEYSITEFGLTKNLSMVSVGQIKNYIALHPCVLSTWYADSSHLYAV